MSRSTAEFECECTVRTVFDYRKPELFHPNFVDVKCRGCDAVWTMRFRQTTEGVTFSFKLKEPSAKLGEFLKQKKALELANAPVKKDPQFFIKH